MVDLAMDCICIDNLQPMNVFSQNLSFLQQSNWGNLIGSLV
jgi:hypothetical protein